VERKQCGWSISNLLDETKPSSWMKKIVILSEASRSFIAGGEVEGPAVLHLAMSANQAGQNRPFPCLWAMISTDFLDTTDTLKSEE
jgi:hypothetical protein